MFGINADEVYSSLNMMESTMYQIKDGDIEVEEYTEKEIEAMNKIVELSKYIATEYKNYIFKK